MGVKKVKEALPAGATPETRPDLFGTRGQFARDQDGGMITFVNDADKPEYATPEASGVERGFYVADRGLPWHVALSRTLGTRELMEGRDSLLGVDEAWEALGGIEIAKVPVLTPDGVPVPGWVATVDAKTGAPTGGVVSPRYNVFQERDLIQLAVDLVDAGAIIETGAHMAGTSRFWVSLELPSLEVSVPGDESGLQSYLLLRSGHDGGMKAQAYITQVRSVCANTENLAIDRSKAVWMLSHRSRLEGHIEEARRSLGIAFKQSQEVKALTTILARKRLVDDQVREILEKAVWPVSGDSGKVSRHAAAAYEDYLESPTLDGIRGTAWGAYNAVTEYLDHVLDYKDAARRTEGRRQPADEVRAEYLIDGRGAEVKNRALRALVTAAK